MAVVSTLTFAAACDGSPSAPANEPTEIEIVLQGVGTLDPAIDGAYEVWVVDDDGRIESAGRFAFGGRDSVVVSTPVENPAHVVVTVEPPGDDDAMPSALKLLGGRFDDAGLAVLDVTGYVTPIGMPLEVEPGVHVLGMADGRAGAGMRPDAGLWLVDTRVDSTDASYFQTFTPLTRGWTYEGWIVRDQGSPREVWLSYGQFVSNNLRKARFRDDTGIGPFSGFTDYERALTTAVHYPGDDWIANPAARPVPGGLTLPLDLDGDAAAGEPSRWRHVITIEPRYDLEGTRKELPWEAKPFFLRPYGNDIGEAAPATPRVIDFVPGALPSGRARATRRNDIR